MSSGIIIFARMSSKRLPGKPLIEIEGRTLLGRVIDRCKNIKTTNKIIIATSKKKNDDLISRFASKEGILCFRGDLADVSKRALDCAKKFNLKQFARICADRPFLDPKLIDELFQIHLKHKFDLTTNIQVKTYPSGLTSEIISINALEKMLLSTDKIYDREHVTSFFYKHPEFFYIYNKICPRKYDKEISLVVDTKEDLNKASFIARKIKDQKILPSTDKIIFYAKQWNMQQNSLNIK